MIKDEAVLLDSDNSKNKLRLCEKNLDNKLSLMNETLKEREHCVPSLFFTGL
jgi:hypothetical protein